MDPKEKFREILREGALRFSAEELPLSIERPANPEHGDYASNIALQLCKRLRRNPRQIAEEIARASAPALAATGLFEPLTVAGAGFLNIRVKPEAKLEVIRQVLEQGKDYGRAKTEKEESIQIEFVTANPTGPLHVGHGRGAAYGDSLAKLLEFAGARVTREFYVTTPGGRWTSSRSRSGCVTCKCATWMSLFRRQVTGATMCATSLHASRMKTSRERRISPARCPMRTLRSTG